MADAQTRVNCPACAHQIELTPNTDLNHLVCPHCEAPISPDAVRGETEIAEEIAPGFRPGQKLGNYVVESLIGTGGMAVVFKARQLSLNRPVALKVLPKHLAKNKMFVQRFGSEAAALASLNHANVVSVIDRGCEDGTYFIVMEYVEGVTLKQRLDKKGRLLPREVYPIARQVLAGLDYAHRRSVVHRDIKPGNVIINLEEGVKIADFGLAHLAKQEGGLDHTRDNQTMGTLKYMAPEQLSAAKYVDGRADLYSFGVCLYEMLTGKLPVGTFKMPSEFDSALDIRWDDIIFRVLKTEPEERYASAAEMAKAIDEIANSPEVTIHERDLEDLAEEEEAREKAQIPLTACAKCGHESPPTVQVCERCKARLKDIFEKCPQCGTVSRVDVATCPKCRNDLEAHRVKLRRAAETIQTKAAKLVAAKRYDLALPELKRLLKFRTREYAAVRESARIWIERVQTKAEKYQQRVYEAGRRMMAEARYDAAVKTWLPLPDTYKDIAKWREEVAVRREEAQMALSDGNQLYKSGDIAGAVSAWKKSAAFWPNNEELRKCLARAKIQLGNFNLKQTCLHEAREAAEIGNFDEAIWQCRHVLELDPSDASTLSLLDEITLRQQEQTDEGGAVESRCIAPHALASPPRRSVFPKILATLGILALIAGLVAFVVFVYLPYSARQRTDRARRVLSQVETNRLSGDFDQAISDGQRLLSEYPGTDQAKKALTHLEEMKAMIEASRVACAKIDTLAKQQDIASLETAFAQYAEILAVPPISEIEQYRAYVTRQVEKVRNQLVAAIVAEAAAHERKGDWRAALVSYKAAANKYGATSEEVTSGLARAREHAEGSVAFLEEAKAAIAEGKWGVAATACAAALDRSPADGEAHEMLRHIVENLPVPKDMVLVQAGEYRIGGVSGNPVRMVTVPHGFFVDQSEVTHARYAEFIRTTNRTAPAGWGPGGALPPGSELLPITNVTWADAQAFAEWTGCQLPTENDWECAARGSSGRVYSWGNEWNPNAAVLGFGPAPVGEASQDRSVDGAMDTVGNVAEWTATRVALVQPSAPSGRRPTREHAARAVVEPKDMYIVKGSSWVGNEQGRPTTIVSGDRTRVSRSQQPSPTMVSGERARVGAPRITRLGGSRQPPPTIVSGERSRASGSRQPIRPPVGGVLVLTPDPDTPEVSPSSLVNIEMLYLGPFGTDEGVSVLVRRWLPEWATWAEARYSVNVDGSTPIGDKQTLKTVTAGPKSISVSVQVDFSTQCVAVQQKSKEWLDVRFPDGVIRRLPYVGAMRAEPLTLEKNKPEPPKSGQDIRDTARCAARMTGTAQSRYVNVGFRCVKKLWTAPEPEATPASDAPSADSAPK